MALDREMEDARLRRGGGAGALCGHFGSTRNFSWLIWVGLPGIRTPKLKILTKCPYKAPTPPDGRRTLRSHTPIFGGVARRVQAVYSLSLALDCGVGGSAVRNALPT